MRLRTIVSFLLVFIVGIVFSGCTNTPDTTDPVASTTETTSTAPETTVPVVPETATPAEDSLASPEVEADREVIALINGDPAYSDEFEAAKGALLNQYAQTYAQFGMDIGMLLTGPEGRVFELGVEAESLMQIVQLIRFRARRRSRIPDANCSAYPNKTGSSKPRNCHL